MDSRLTVSSAELGSLDQLSPVRFKGVEWLCIEIDLCQLGPSAKDPFFPTPYSFYSGGVSRDDTTTSIQHIANLVVKPTRSIPQLASTGSSSSKQKKQSTTYPLSN